MNVHMSDIHYTYRGRGRGGENGGYRLNMRYMSMCWGEGRLRQREAEYTVVYVVQYTHTVLSKIILSNQSLVEIWAFGLVKNLKVLFPKKIFVYFLSCLSKINYRNIFAKRITCELHGEAGPTYTDTFHIDTVAVKIGLSKQINFHKECNCLPFYLGLF